MNKLILVTSLFMLVSCSSTSKPSHYYSLNLNTGNSIVTPKINSNKTKILIAPIRLAPFLKQQGLVMQRGKHEIIIANYHKWAEPLQQSIEKLLQRDLNNLSKEDYFERETAQWSGSPSATIMLRIEIDKFHATDKSTVVVAGRYYINNNDAAEQIIKEFNISKNLTEDGYLHSIEVLESSVKDLAKDIVNELVKSE
jgi:hypothetical protein